MDYALAGVVAIITIVAVAAFAPRLGIAAPLLLVVVGIGFGLVPAVPPIEPSPELILAGVLPPLLYSAAVNVPLVDFRRNLKPIAGLSVLLVVVSAFVTGYVLFLLLPDLSLAAAIALGAVISPTDAVAATSIGKRLGLPPRLVTVLEGESLVNDATALVLLRSAIAATAGAVSVLEVAGDFVFAVVVAVLIGIVVGQVTVRVRAWLDNAVLNTAISFAVPFIAYLPAEALGASGVLAVVAAGLVTGHQSARYFTAQARITERMNWRTIQFLLENAVFLLMGVELVTIVEQVTADDLGVPQAVWLGLLCTIILIAIRGVFVVPLIAMLRRESRRAHERAPRIASLLGRVRGRETANENEERRIRRVERVLERRQSDVEFARAEGLGWRGGAVLAWSGMRGVVTLAAAQSLPENTPYRPQLVLIAFTVAIATLLIQGGTLPLVIKVIGLRRPDARHERDELATLVTHVGDVALSSLDSPELRQLSGETYDPEVVERVRQEIAIRSAAAIEQAQSEDAPGPHRQFTELKRRILNVERRALLDAQATGRYSSRVLSDAQRNLDIEMTRLDTLDG